MKQNKCMIIEGFSDKTKQMYDHEGFSDETKQMYDHRRIFR